MEYLIKKLFGTSSEKTKKLEGRYNLFDEAEQETISTDETEIAESVPVKEYTRKAESLFKSFPPFAIIEDHYIYRDFFTHSITLSIILNELMQAIYYYSKIPVE